MGGGMDGISYIRPGWLPARLQRVSGRWRAEAKHVEWTLGQRVEFRQPLCVPSVAQLSLFQNHDQSRGFVVTTVLYIERLFSQS